MLHFGQTALFNFDIKYVSLQVGHFVYSTSFDLGNLKKSMNLSYRSIL